MQDDMADAESRLSEIEERLDRMEIRLNQMERLSPAATESETRTNWEQLSVRASAWISANPVLAVLGGVVLIVILSHLLD